MTEQEYRVLVQDWMKSWGYKDLTSSAAQADLADRLVRIERPVPTTEKPSEACGYGCGDCASCRPYAYQSLPTREQIATVYASAVSSQLSPGEFLDALDVLGVPIADDALLNGADHA